MRILQITIVSILISCRFAVGQEINRSLIGKLLVNSEFEFIELINDSLVYSSLNNFNDSSKYKIVGKDFVIMERIYEQNTTLGYETQMFKYYIDKQTDSSLTLISPNNFKLDFFDIKTLDNEIYAFESIELEYLTPWDNSRLIKIDSSGNYSDKIKYLPLKSRRLKRKHKTIKYSLSDKETNILKQKLSEYYATQLPNERGCPIDGVISNFVIRTNGREINSKGCDLSWIHNKLLDYLLHMKEAKD